MSSLNPVFLPLLNHISVLWLFLCLSWLMQSSSLWVFTSSLSHHIILPSHFYQSYFFFKHKNSSLITSLKNFDVSPASTRKRLKALMCYEILSQFISLHLSYLDTNILPALLSPKDDRLCHAFGYTVSFVEMSFWPCFYLVDSNLESSQVSQALKPF